MSLLERFTANPALTRHELRVKLGVLDELAAEVFALTVFLCDELLQLKPALAVTTDNPAAATAVIRFFAIAMKLPMELQMVLCRRAVSSMKQSILHKDSEVAFRALAQTFPFIRVESATSSSSSSSSSSFLSLLSFSFLLFLFLLCV